MSKRQGVITKCSRRYVCEYCGQEIGLGEAFVSRHIWVKGDKGHRLVGYLESKKRRPRRYSHASCFEKCAMVEV